MMHRLVRSTLALVLLAGCWPYHTVSSTCPDPGPPATPFHATVSRSAAHEVRGRAVSDDAGAPLEAVELQLVGQPGKAYSAADGRFVLHVDSGGTYELYARRVGYSVTRGTLVVTPDTTATIPALVVPMKRSTLVFDACGYAQVRERRHWWQWWYPPPREER